MTLPVAGEGTVSLPNASGAFNRFRVTVLRGPDAEKTVEAVSEECAIGTSPANQLVLTDPLVSGHHCVIRASAEGAMVLDLGSTNGTRVGGLRIEAAFLTSGLTVEVGDSVLRFEVLEERINPTLSAENQVGGLYAVSAAMRGIFAIVLKVASSEVPVLLEGEAGVGKSALARLLHESGDRASEPLEVVELDNVPVGQMEARLFGGDDEPGALAAAGAGTLIIEEIGQLPPPLQTKLLGALDALDARLVATTQTDLREAVNSKRFRPDLFYKLSAIRLRVPPLRERREDIPPLIERFYGEATGESDAAPPAELIERLFWRPWPGNVRELQAVVARATVIDDPTLQRELARETPDEPKAFDFDPSLSYRESKEVVVGEFERWYAQELIRRHGGNLSRAARAARMDRSYLRELLRRHEIPLPSEAGKK